MPASTTTTKTLAARLASLRTTLEPLVWKEWQEGRWILLGGILIALLFSQALAGLALGPGGLVMVIGELVGVFGPPMALLIGVACACRDTRQRLEGFWHSRPISLDQWIGAKFLMGLGIIWAILLAAIFPSVVIATYIQWLDKTSWGPGTGLLNTLLNRIPLHFWSLATIYSAAFLVGTLLRDAAKAAIVSIGFMLLILFLPMLIPPIGWMSVHTLIERNVVRHAAYAPYPAGSEWFVSADPMRRRDSWAVAVHVDYLRFAGGSLLLCMVFAVLSWAALKSQWRLSANPKLIYWSLGVVALLLYGAGSAQVASNIEPSVTFAPLPPNEVALDIAERDGRGVIVTVPTRDRFMINEPVPVALRLFDLAHPSDPYGPATALPCRALYWLSCPELLLNRSDPTIVYILAKDTVADRVQITGLRLLTVRLENPKPQVISDLNLSPAIKRQQMFLYRSGKRLQLLGENKIGVWIDSERSYRIKIDISSATSPKIAGTEPVSQNYSWNGLFGETEEIRWYLRDLPGTPQQKLQASQEAQKIHSPNLLWEGDILIAASETGLSTYELSGVSASEAQYKRLGQLRYSPLERWLTYNNYRIMKLGNFAWVQDRNNAPSATIYDLHDPREPRKLGHFARPGGLWHATTVTSDGRLLLASDRLYLFDPADWKR